MSNNLKIIFAMLSITGISVIFLVVAIILFNFLSIEKNKTYDQIHSSEKSISQCLTDAGIKYSNYMKINGTPIENEDGTISYVSDYSVYEKALSILTKDKKDCQNM